MFDHSVYSALNGCSETGLERPFRQEHMPNGAVIRVFVDNFKQYRAVAFESVAHCEGYSGVLLNPDGSIRWMNTASHMRGNDTIRQLLWFMRSVGIKWQVSDHLTDDGKACFKINE